MIKAELVSEISKKEYVFTGDTCEDIICLLQVNKYIDGTILELLKTEGYFLTESNILDSAKCNVLVYVKSKVND